MPTTNQIGILIVLGVAVFAVGFFMPAERTVEKRVCLDTGEPYHETRSCGFSDTAVLEVQEDNRWRVPLIAIGVAMVVGGVLVQANKPMDETTGASPGEE